MGVKTSFTTANLYEKNLSGNRVDHLVNFNRSRTGVDLPGYHHKINVGENATTALTAFTESLVFYDPGSINVSSFGSYYPDISVVNKFNLFPTGHGDGSIFAMMDKAVAQSTSAAFSKIRAKQTPFEGQVFLGEIRETLQFLRHPLETTLKLAQALEKKKGKLKTAKAIADTWLEFRFGILPLIGDSIRILELAQTVADRKEILSYRTYGMDEKTTRSVSTEEFFDGTIFYDLVSSYHHKVECITRFGILAKALDSFEGYKSALENSVLDLKTVPITAWELTQFSWLVDYFVNIADILEAASTGVSSVSWQSQSRIWTTEFTQTATNFRDSYHATQSSLQRPGLLSTKRRDVSRTGASLEIPPLVFSLPGSKIRYANIAAVLTQLTNRRSL